MWWDRIAAGYFLDLLVGDPAWLPHPVVLIGKAITWLENLLRQIAKNPLTEKIAGIFLVAVIVLGTGGLTWGAVSLAEKLHPAAGWIVGSILIFTTLATKSLAQAARQVSQPLAAGNLEEARKYLGYIVGRDTQNLQEGEITRGVVETVAENIVDGIISPLFYAFLGGAPLAMAYKAINTLDSMIAYKNSRYLHFGWAAAKLDDLANYLPARLTGLLLWTAILFRGKDYRKAWKIMRRDAAKHPSPNGGIPESLVAGGLGIRLGGYNSYHGQMSFRAYLGDPDHPLGFSHIEETITLMKITSLLGLACGTVLSILLAKLGG